MTAYLFDYGCVSGVDLKKSILHFVVNRVILTDIFLRKRVVFVLWIFVCCLVCDRFVYVNCFGVLKQRSYDALPL